MSLVRWDPFNDLFKIQDQMNRVFEDYTNRRQREKALDATWAPAVDVYEDTERFVIKAELPEISAKDVDIRLENNVLKISGERKLERDEKKDQYHTIERFYGRFSRSFTLPDTVDQEKISAETKDGVLTISLPKKPETKPRAIQIKVK